MYSSFDHTPVTVVQNLVNLLCHLNILNVTFRHKRVVHRVRIKTAPLNKML